MTEIITNIGDLRDFLEEQENLGVKNLEIVISENVLERSPEIANKYGYSIIDGEDLPNGYFKLTLEYRGVGKSNSHNTLFN
ncbi:hypothetical protein [Acidianus sp. HS-5]|uniref:hypothetical protein n=1 Tax=Acidianus sp. HS-5 TaxID=2886040 RepID=UPI001F45246A|nr:hypothetical protein [Acidianus sp. HS-5]BDC18429.1 hypothetical protein HS5_13190 [Acidianus sp. HS-5]